MSQNWTEFSRKSAGPTVNAESAPYSVLIMSTELPNICSGTLVSFSLIITAARCFYKGTEVRSKNLDATVEVYAGTNSISSIQGPNVQKGEVIGIDIHPNFRLKKDKMHFGYNDLGLIYLGENLRETPFVRTIPLGYLDWTYNPDGVECSLAMYSSINPLSISPQDDLLRLATVSVSHQCQCSDKLEMYFGQRSDRWICPTPGQSARGPCLGSAGAGLVCQDKLVALLVGMIPFDSLDQCVFSHSKNVTCRSSHNLPIFMDLCPFLRWIYYVMRDPSVPMGPEKCSRACSTNGLGTLGLVCWWLLLVVL